jgi:hypothetical protein
MMLKNCTRIALLGVMFSLVVACNATPDSEEPEQCRTQNEEACNESAEDRGYNPCLVNNKLPVCKGK